MCVCVLGEGKMKGKRCVRVCRVSECVRERQGEKLCVGGKERCVR